MPSATRQSIESPRAVRRSSWSAREPDGGSRRPPAVRHHGRRSAAVLALALVASGCDQAEPSTPSRGLGAIPGSSWAVAYVDGQPPIAGTNPTVTFAAEHLSGSGGCNRFDGRYTL